MTRGSPTFASRRTQARTASNWRARLLLWPVFSCARTFSTAIAVCAATALISSRSSGLNAENGSSRSAYNAPCTPRLSDERRANRRAGRPAKRSNRTPANCSSAAASCDNSATRSFITLRVMVRPIVNLCACASNFSSRARVAIGNNLALSAFLIRDDSLGEQGDDPVGRRRTKDDVGRHLENPIEIKA